jgi:aquaporin Z
MAERSRLMISALRAHWPMYLMEAGGLALFMISASLFGVILEHPDSSVHRIIVDPFHRRVLMGVAMGLTAIALIYSPLGKRSGAHLNPSVTLAFLRLGRIKSQDAVFYIAAQFAGGIAGVMIAWYFLGSRLAQRPPHFVATIPGMNGVILAFVAEAVISAMLMLVVLFVSSSRFANYTGLCAGVLVALYIAFESPISGMSMNPARTFGSALAARDLTGLWIYFTAPPLGMLVSSTLYRWLFRDAGCAKLYHAPDVHCIFCQE